MPKTLHTSRTTCGVAVAVRASTQGEPGNCETMLPMRRNEGRKLCDQADTQCASSTHRSDTSGTVPLLSRRWKLLANSRSGDTNKTSSARALSASSTTEVSAAELRDDRHAPRKPGGSRAELIFHEREQWRHDKREARQHKGGQLVAERLARAGGHDAQGGLTGQHALDRPQLTWAEAVVVEHGAQDAPQDLCVGADGRGATATLRRAARSRGAHANTS